MIKQDFFTYIDKNGIDGAWKGGMSMTIDPHQDKELPALKMKDDYFEPYMFQFKLSSSEKIELIKEYFKETFNIHIDNLSEISKLSVLNNKLFLVPTYDNNLLAYRLVKQNFEFDLYLRNVYGVKDLGVIESINGGLYLSNTSIQSLHPLKHLNGDFWLSGTTLEFLTDIGDLEVVTGTLNISKSKIKSLGNLKYVGRNLNLRSTDILDLSNIEEIGGNLLLNKLYKNQYILNTEIVKGTIKYFNV